MNKTLNKYPRNIVAVKTLDNITISYGMSILDLPINASGCDSGGGVCQLSKKGEKYWRPGMDTG